MRKITKPLARLTALGLVLAGLGIGGVAASPDAEAAPGNYRSTAYGSTQAECQRNLNNLARAYAGAGNVNVVGLRSCRASGDTRPGYQFQGLVYLQSRTMR